MKIANGNPELEGAKTYKEFLNNRSYREDNKYNRSLWKDLGGDKNSNTRMIEGNIDSKHIVDGKGYKKLSTKELKDYIKKNPKKFLRGAGKLSLGVSGVYIGGKLLRNNAENSKSNSIDNSEKILVSAGAIGSGIKTARTELKKVKQNDVIGRSKIDQFSSGSFRKKALLAAKTKKNIINLEGSLLDSTTPMSHEYGHILNSKNPRTRKVGMRIRRLQNQENKTTSNRFFGKAKSTWNIARLNNSIVSEEKNAWKNGINALKRNGATSEDLKYTNKYKNAALDTYKSSRNLKIVSKVYDMFKSKNSVNPIESLMKDRKYKWNAVDLGSNL